MAIEWQSDGVIIGFLVTLPNIRAMEINNKDRDVLERLEVELWRQETRFNLDRKVFGYCAFIRVSRLSCESEWLLGI
jgi:hypothetical protein